MKRGEAITKPKAAAADSGHPLREWSQRARVTAVQSLRYSVFVTVMKRALPVAAIAILGAVIAYSVIPRHQEKYSLFYQEAGKGADSLTMTRPRLTGTDAKGNPYTISVEEATQDPNDPHRASLKQVEADMQYDSGQNWASATAGEGYFDMDAGTLKLGNGIALYTDSGYELHTKAADVNLKKGLFQGQDKVKGHGPLGAFSADRFALNRLDKHIQLDGHVHMTMYPREARR